MRDRWDTGRIEAFSDGVFSVAATLLVLEISVPEADFDHLWKGIGDQWPSYLAYATSFLTVGYIWLAHHAIFRCLRFADSIVTRLNLVLLMAVAFLPFPTKLVAEAIDSSSAERTAVLFYGATLLVISVLVTAMVRYAGSRPDLIEEDRRDQVVALAAQASPNLGFYVGVLALAFLLPKVAAFGFLAIAVFAIWHVRGESRMASSAGRSPS
jgi:TMEM175 potassium channel family protein